MAKIWTPDFCPPGNPCRVEIASDWGGPVQFLRLCAHHQSLRNGGMTDAQLFRVLLQSCRVKETARYKCKVDLGLDKEHPGLPYTVDASGNITIQSGASGAARTALRNAVATEVNKLDRPSGTSTVTVA